MRHQASVDIEAGADQVWAVLVDIGEWPSWNPTVTSVHPLQDGPWGLGSTAEIRQPKLPKATWQVSRFEPGERFEWITTSPGITTRADHRVDPLDGGRSHLTLELHQTGPLAGLVSLFLGTLTRRYVDLEAQSLKQHCEAPLTR